VSLVFFFYFPSAKVLTKFSPRSCGPNATYAWDLRTFSMIMVAQAPIASGEEITLAYTEIAQPRAARHAKLERMYGFTCECKYCVLSNSKAVEQSDRAREEIHYSYSKTSMTNDLSARHEELVNYLIKILVMIKREGMFYKEAGHLDLLAMLYGQRNDMKRWRMWGEKALRAYTALQDSEEEMEKWQGWLTDERKFGEFLKLSRVSALLN